jgi:hypothetical protein
MSCRTYRSWGAHRAVQSHRSSSQEEVYANRMNSRTSLSSVGDTVVDALALLTGRNIMCLFSVISPMREA